MPDPETIRRLSNRDRILAYLERHGRATNVELLEIGGFRYGGRLHELRKQGYPDHDDRQGARPRGIRISRQGDDVPAAVGVECMRVPLFWRFVNAIRRWDEDRHVTEGRYLTQMRAVAQVKTPAKVIRFRNLTVVRSERRQVA